MSPRTLCAIFFALMCLCGLATRQLTRLKQTGEGTENPEHSKALAKADSSAFINY